MGGGGGGERGIIPNLDLEPIIPNVLV